ncbi:MAG: hypothetical protein AB4352_13510 [Hormoscilla sp.]
MTIVNWEIPRSSQAIGYSLPQIGKISTLLAVAIVAGLLLHWLHVPVAWPIGPVRSGNCLWDHRW